MGLNQYRDTFVSGDKAKKLVNPKQMIMALEWREEKALGVAW